jgi:hypothetical protein
VGVRHERGRDGDGKFARVLQLIDGGRVEVVAPDSVWRVRRSRHERGFCRFVSPSGVWSFHSASAGVYGTSSVRRSYMGIW